MGKIMMRDLLRPLSEKELKEIENAEKRECVFDEDCPPGSPVYLTKNGHGAYAVVHIEDQEETEKMKAALRYMCEMNKGIRAGEEEGWLSIDQVRAHMKERRHAEEG